MRGIALGPAPAADVRDAVLVGENETVGVGLDAVGVHPLATDASNTSSATRKRITPIGCRDRPLRASEARPLTSYADGKS